MTVRLLLRIAAFCVLMVNLAHGLTGSGTAFSPFLISNLNDFQQYCANSGYWGSGQYTKLTSDIDLSGVSFNAAPIAPDTQIDSWFQGVEFAGYFNGNGHVVKNLSISGNEDSWYVSLFGQIGSSGIIENLGVVDCNLTGDNRVSGICGWNKGIVRQCFATGKATGRTNVAGICGYNEGGTISGCYSDVEVLATNNAAYAGGIVGINEGPISDCFAMGSVSAGHYYLGGLCGLNRSSITDCYSIGYVYSYTSSIYESGFCGYGSASITGCFWDWDTSGAFSSYGGTGKSSSQLKQQATYTSAGWDFSDTWKMSSLYGGYEGYPILSWMNDFFGYEYWAKASLPEGQRDATFCAAGDAVPNLLKYACGLNPTEKHTDSDLYTVTYDEDYLIIQYSVSKEIGGVSIEPVFKDSLGLERWEKGGVSPVKIQDEDSFELWEVRLPLQSQCYMRIQADFVE